MTYEDKRIFMKGITKSVEEKASKADLYYVICFWMSPIIDTIDHRQAYFDDLSEAVGYQARMIQQYERMKYYIASNISSGDTNGGLL